MSNPQQPSPMPSKYELEAWDSIQQFKGRPLSHAMQNAGENVANGVAQLGKRAAKQLEKHPRAASGVARGQEFVAKGACARCRRCHAGPLSVSLGAPGPGRLVPSHTMAFRSAGGLVVTAVLMPGWPPRPREASGRRG